MRSDTESVSHPREALAPQGCHLCVVVPVAPAVRTHGGKQRCREPR